MLLGQAVEVGELLVNQLEEELLRIGYQVFAQKHEHVGDEAP